MGRTLIFSFNPLIFSPNPFVFKSSIHVELTVMVENSIMEQAFSDIFLKHNLSMVFF
jgi:hypothetical protein